MTVKPGRKARFIITKNLIIMLVMLVVGLLAVWSWFSINKMVTAEGMTVTASVPNELGLAKVIKNYDTNGVLVSEGPGKFVGQLDFTPGSYFQLTKDCTGDGETLIIPDFSIVKDKEEAVKTGRLVNLNGPWEEALSNRDAEQILNNNPDAEVEPRYYEFEFYLRSAAKVIHLNNNSFLRSETERSGNLSSTPSSDKVSSYSTHINCDSLVGAIRVALLAQGVTSITQTYNSQDEEVTSTSCSLLADNGNVIDKQLSMLWVPRPDLHLNVTGNDSTNWTVTTGVIPSTTFADNSTGETECYTHNYYTNFSAPSGTNTYPIRGGVNITKRKGTGIKLGEGVGNKLFVTSADSVSSSTYPMSGTLFDVSDINGRNELSQIELPIDYGEDENAPRNKSTYYVYKYTMRIWIEGTDSEARRAMDGGTFDLHLEFI